MPNGSSGVGPVIDPTKNVLDLVAAAIQRQDDLRDAETRRLNELAGQRQHYETIIAELRNESLRLLAEQLKENKKDQGERMSKQEQFRWETGGTTVGRNSLLGYIVSAATLGAAIASVVTFFLKH